MQPKAELKVPERIALRPDWRGTLRVVELLVLLSTM
jgi:hypothetical protein